MAIKFTNNASSKLTQALTTSATSMQIKAEDVSKFPVLGAGDYCLLTLVGDNGNHEIIKVTNISSDGTCTIERAQDSTTAKEWPIENRVELRITAEYLNNTADAKAVEELINTTIPSLPDNVTISFEGDKLQVKDVAIGGDISDLASARGQIGSASYKTGVDLNTIDDSGVYVISTRTPNQNVPVNTNLYLHVFTNRSFGVVQVAYALNSSSSVPFYVRRKTASGSTWIPWVRVIDTANIGDGITVNNGIISVPEYEGATSSASATSGLVPPATSAERNSFLRGDGTWVVPDDNSTYIKDLSVDGTTITYTKGDNTTGTITTQDTTYSEMTGATSSANGTSGLVPTPQAGEQDFFLRGDGTWAVASGLPLGHFFTWPFSTPPDGSIIVNGSTYSRTLYADLWTYISSKSDWVKTESEWQSIASANGGYCPYYSNGDGSTTFRVPKFAPYQQIALSTASAGTYHKAGLPDIYGSFAGMWNSIGLSGAFGGDFSENPQSNLPLASSAYENHYAKFYFNASKCSDKYGKSDTVQPESNEWIVCVVAYGRATNVGNVDVANVIYAVNTVQSNLTNVISSVDTVRSELTNYLPTAGGTLTGPIRFNLPGTEDYTGNIIALNDQYGKRILIDTYEEGDCGAFIHLFKGSSEINPGGFEICARNADSSVVKVLAARTDGNLWWDGKQIVRSVNGATADSTGNVLAMPVGSVYVQFSGQSAPADLFGGTWSNVSSIYAGLFFRAEGGNAAAFGRIQTGGLPNITGTFDRPERNGFASTSGVFYNPNQNGGGYARDEPISSANVGFNASRSSGLYGASEEVRPVNSAIRIWKRTA